MTIAHIDPIDTSAPRLDAPAAVAPDAPADRHDSEQPTPLDRDSLIGGAAARGGAIGFVVVAVAIAVSFVAGGIETGGAAGLGLFLGMWGGLGFGGMLGGVYGFTRYLDDDHDS